MLFINAIIFFQLAIIKAHDIYTISSFSVYEFLIFMKTGIEKVEVDANSQKVVVTGYAHRNKILKAIRRGGLKADFWSAQNELLNAYASASYGSLRFSNFNFF